MTLLSIAMTTYQVSSRGHYMHIILALTLAPYVNQLNHMPLLQVQLVCTHFLLFSLSPMPQFVGYQQFVGYLQLTNSTSCDNSMYVFSGTHFVSLSNCTMLLISNLELWCQYFALKAKSQVVFSGSWFGEAEILHSFSSPSIWWGGSSWAPASCWRGLWDTRNQLPKMQWQEI